MNEMGALTAQHQIRTAVLFLIFNRPDTTQLVFNEIRKAKPKQLFVAADGPRKDRPEDAFLCNKTRAIVDQVDWDCKVTTLYRSENLGCKVAVSSAIDWFFSNVEEGIILEDDIVPDQSFFPFCQELLEKYRDDERIMMISGDNYHFEGRKLEYSYYFSRYTPIWGWATWKRAWKHYDVNMKLWPIIRDGNWLKDILNDERAVDYWLQCFDNTFAGKIDTWDYQWTFTCWIQHGLSILHDVNLVSNIGFDERATHTKGHNLRANLQVNSVKFPLIHPEFIIRNNSADCSMQKSIFYNQTYNKIKGEIKKYLFKLREFL